MSTWPNPANTKRWLIGISAHHQRQIRAGDPPDRRAVLEQTRGAATMSE
jgi:hypothetical protein